MEDLLGIIIPLIAVVGWLFGMFKNEDSEENNGQPVPKPPQTTPGPAQTETRKSNPEQHAMEAGEESRAQTYYEKKREKMSELKTGQTNINRSEINQGASINDNSRTERTSSVKEDRNKASRSNGSSSELSIRRNLSRNGIAGSVVMAEVLGQPRALRPYKRSQQTK
ncbi:hypothetical protein [Sediminibacillus albus]|uniref:Uncharacterized protein n=1 Tax=Sediminibacillus albus TaxID=407036 RepID=A0A1G9CPS4_9BACI|nr:hypothetical protein [Sediminibacillus albus]SDK53576.1 hypothetical protein SAMN05216243_3476 [Sediminibacillus albus]